MAGDGPLLGIDLGGTYAKIARFTAAGDREAEAQMDTAGRPGAGSMVDALARCAEELLGGDAPAGLGIGVAGVLDLTSGRVIESPNIPQLTNFPLLNALREHFPGVPAAMMNDANAAALGEYHAGAGAGTGSMVLLTLGTGIGGGIVLGGKLWEGAARIAGEIGHMCVQAEGPACHCGARGCLEACVSGWALLRDAEELARTSPGSPIAKLTPRTPEGLAELAQSGDAQARALWERAGRMLGVGLASIMNLLNPECIVLTGGLVRAGELLMTPARAAWESQAFEAAHRAAQVKTGALGGWAGVRGAIQPFMESTS
ncbi:MAG: ROK family protein [bacterium]|nr:ROK family protein [bacterium]